MILNKLFPRATVQFYMKEVSVLSDLKISEVIIAVIKVNDMLIGLR